MKKTGMGNFDNLWAEVLWLFYQNGWYGKEGYEAIIRKESSMISKITEILNRAIEVLDFYTRKHSIEVSVLAFWLAKYIGLSDWEQEMVKLAGLVHDIGKVSIPETILNKPGPLNADEWEIMKRHPLKSAEIIQPIPGFQEIAYWILYHHEHWDGRGYPEGRKRKEIPAVAQILAVCDAYSAMTSNRPYRNALSEEEAKEEIRNFSGIQFDPEIVEIFLSLPKEDDPKMDSWS
ncbi:MAG: HD-GYP domain-containing protein [candidate division WOR-3 bacterium]